MPIIVQKFGGTSVADTEKITSAARKAIRAHENGYQVVMVVSAMGKNTDLLVSLANELNDRPPAREMDMLLSTGEQVSVALMAMAIHALGYKAISLTGAQIGIKTDSTHTKARIRSISTDRMKSLLDDGNIVIAAGFQGIDDDHNITTLGRGGSDTTAVALAAVLEAEACEIYTDVDGVYTTDPRILPMARRVNQVSYDEMLELASLGSGVMHNRSIEFAKKYGVNIHVRSSMLTDNAGTLITSLPEAAGRAVSGAAMTRKEARISLLGVPDIPGASLAIFAPIAQRNVTVDMIVQNIGEESKADISFTVPEDELPATIDALAETRESIAGITIDHSSNVAKISAVGLGMADQSGVAMHMFKALADAEVNIQMITTSEIKTSVLVDRDDAQSALRAVHSAFQLETEPEGAAPPPTQIPSRSQTANAIDVIARLRDVDMEDLTIDDISLDQSQGRVTINGVPNKPGIAVRVFQQIAEAGIFVDMIVQSYAGHSAARMTFTVPRDMVAAAVEATESIARELGCSSVTSEPAVAKLSVSGIGLRSHTGVAIRMFRALTEVDINVDMVSTSEVRVNVVVASDSGETALASLKEAFADVFGK